MSWSTRKLGDVLKIQNGYAFDSKKFSIEDGTPLIRIRDIKKGIGTETKYLGEYDSKYIVKKGDLLIGMDGEFGCYEWKGEDSLLNQRVCRLQEFKNIVVPKFLLYGINSYLKAIEDVTGFITVKHLSSKQIANIDFPLPSLATQQKIVEKLDAIFAEIDRATVAVEANVKNANYLTLQVLQNLDDEYDGEFKSLGSCVDLVSGFAFKSNEYTSNESDIPLLRGDNLNPKSIDLSNAKRYDKNRFDEFKKFSLRAGDIVLGMDRPLISTGLRIAKVENDDLPLLLVQRVMRMRCNEGVDSDFIFYQLNSERFIKHLLGEQTGLGVPHISGKTISSFHLKIPNLVTQKIIVNKLNLLSEQLCLFDDSTLKLQRNFHDLKNSILKQAFSGELVKE